MRVLSMSLLALAACGSREEPLRIRQRSETPIAPGVVLKVGDIRLGGGAQLAVVAGSKTLLEKEARAGDRLDVAVDGQAWEVEVLRLEHHLAHEDYVHVFVRRK
jgi:hypothetical protein